MRRFLHPKHYVHDIHGTIVHKTITGKYPNPHILIVKYTHNLILYINENEPSTTVDNNVNLTHNMLTERS